MTRKLKLNLRCPTLILTFVHAAFSEKYVIKEFEELASDNTSGATELIHRLLGTCEMCLMGGAVGELKVGLESLLTEQLGLPSFHAVLHTLRRDLEPLLATDVDIHKSLSYIASLQQLLDESATNIASNFLTLLPKPQKILTMSRSSTVIEALSTAQEKKKIDHLFVLESRPMCEGVKTIRDFSGQGIPSTLIIDGAMADGVKNVDLVVVGADGISADGFLLNKTGTFALALVCLHQEKPLYVLCDSLKFSPQLRADIIIEDQPIDEVIEKQPTDRFDVWNRYFDWTPIDYITSFVTEKGIYPPDKITQLFSS